MNSLSWPYNETISLNIIPLFIKFLYSISFCCIIFIGLSEFIAEIKAMSRNVCLYGSGKESRRCRISSYFRDNDSNISESNNSRSRKSSNGSAIVLYDKLLLWLLFAEISLSKISCYFTFIGCGWLFLSS